jgi:hypothetical protein
VNVRRLILYEPPLSIGIELYEPGLIDRLQALLDAGDREALLTTFRTKVVRPPPDQVTLMRSSAKSCASPQRLTVSELSMPADVGVDLRGLLAPRVRVDRRAVCRAPSLSAGPISGHGHAVDDGSTRHRMRNL